MKSENTTTTDDPIAEIHEIRRRLAAQHGNDPHRMGKYLRQLAAQRQGTRMKVEKKLVPATAER